jgi:hypothetical protein
VALATPFAKLDSFQDKVDWSIRERAGGAPLFQVLPDSSSSSFRAQKREVVACLAGRLGFPFSFFEKTAAPATVAQSFLLFCVAHVCV